MMGSRATPQVCLAQWVDRGKGLGSKSVYTPGLNLGSVLIAFSDQCLSDPPFLTSDTPTCCLGPGLGAPRGRDTLQPSPVPGGLQLLSLNVPRTSPPGRSNFPWHCFPF